MKLLTKEILKRLPYLYETENKKPSEVKVPLKLFNPCGAGTWYITEFNGEDLMFGFCNLGDDQCAELGYVSLSELKSLRLPFGMSIERDMYWNPDTTLEQVMNFAVR